jgi:flagellar basal body-associated protein FliL
MASEKPAAAPAAASAAADKDAPAKKKGGMKVIIAAAVVVLLEVGTVVVTMKMAGGPKQAAASQPATAPAVKIEKDAEVKVVDAQFPNLQSGRLYLYRFQVAVKVAEKDKTKVTELLAEKEFEIKDQIRTIIASADPESLAEPGAETIRRQVMHRLEEGLGKDMVKDVLIPSLSGTPYP